MIVNIITSLESYGNEFDEAIYKNDGSRTLKGLDFNDIETGIPTDVRYIYVRHDGAEPIYNVGLYIKPVGPLWGGYVQTSPSSSLPYNPNLFREGGINESSVPRTSTVDYNFIREMAANNPDMGCRLHMDRTNPLVRQNGLGFENIGTSLIPVVLPISSLDYSKNPTLPNTPGTLYPEPADQTKYGKVGDEAKIGISLLFPEETEGSGHIQFGLAIKYRYTA